MKTASQAAMYAAADALLDHMVGIEIGQTQPTRKLAPDRGFA